MVFAFAVVALQTAGLFLLVDSLAAYAWMRSDPLVYTFLEGVGILMVGLGGLWALVERRGPRLIGYALLVDFGISLLAMSLGSPAGYRIAMGMAAVRPLSVAVWGAGFANLYAPGRHAEGAPTSVRPIAAAAAMLGALSLAGLPLTAGFAGRWMTLVGAQGKSPLVAAAVLFGIAATWLSVGRWGWTSLRSHPPESESTLPRARRVVMGIGIAAVILLGLLPGWLFAWGLPALAGLAGS
jgi:formate hydrogenlyase subunit 3/multisubunit Na+/H+ antiporter MnhD subunit